MVLRPFCVVLCAVLSASEPTEVERAEALVDLLHSHDALCSQPNTPLNLTIFPVKGTVTSGEPVGLVLADPAIPDGHLSFFADSVPIPWTAVRRVEFIAGTAPTRGENAVITFAHGPSAAARCEFLKLGLEIVDSETNHRVIRDVMLKPQKLTSLLVGGGSVCPELESNEHDSVDRDSNHATARGPEL
eukprot:TRINITY_DN6610_c0_g1_i1.p2 TRINITY_DN6610_c0_g1~~TRINITY_DN6610_c0_g1_i1.p2  ORF type:complete len:188 (+),score=23.08 TRINITY_DN6610_c0_g1_i1:164-727(+)